MTEIGKLAARAALGDLTKGTPPADEIMDFISVGLERDLRVFEEEYFGVDGLLPNTDHGTFKMVEAYYGGGKTHYLRAVERLARRLGFSSAFIELHKDSSPLTNFELIYQRVLENLTLPSPDGEPPAKGIEAVIRRLVTPPDGAEDDPATFAYNRMRGVENLPIPSIRVAIQRAAEAMAADDRIATDEALIYLRTGKASPTMRKQVTLEPIDKKNGVLAIRSIVMWLRQMDVPGFVFIMDEGDRSLSISRSSDLTVASNNLVQLINETSEGWPGVMFLYSIPSWSEFIEKFGGNDALIQRVRSVGFPANPPAIRINLEERYATPSAKRDVCQRVGEKIAALFKAGYGFEMDHDGRAKLIEQTAEVVFQHANEVYFLRPFFKALIGLFHKRRLGEAVTASDIAAAVQNAAA